jgi:hypothetical protein
LKIKKTLNNLQKKCPIMKIGENASVIVDYVRD